MATVIYNAKVYVERDKDVYKRQAQRRGAGFAESRAYAHFAPLARRPHGEAAAEG